MCHTVIYSYGDLFSLAYWTEVARYLGHAFTDVQGVASDPITFTVPVDADASAAKHAKTKSTN